MLQRIDDVSLMCEKRVACLKKLASKPKRPVQQVIPEPGVPLQPPIGAPHPLRLRKSQQRRVSAYFAYFGSIKFFFIEEPTLRQHFGQRYVGIKKRYQVVEIKKQLSKLI